MNNKGFTLVEIIAVIAILGILSGIGIMAATKYIDNSRQKVLSSMKESMYNATENMLTNPPTYDELIKVGYSPTEANRVLNNIDAIKKNSGVSAYTGAYTTAFSAELLIKLDYLENLTNPNDKDENYNRRSKVQVTVDSSSSTPGALKKLTYEVILCFGSGDNISCTSEYFPKE